MNNVTIHKQQSRIEPSNRLPNTVYFWKSSVITELLVEAYTKNGFTVIIIDDNNKILETHHALLKELDNSNK